MILTNKSLATPDVIRNLGMRFRDYRMRMQMTRKEISEAAAIGMTTLYKFESGNMTDISFDTLLRLLRAIGLYENWNALLPELPESPYLYDDKDRKRQRVRKSKKSEL
jgi:DNA-binding helix-turn-helix protein